MEALLGFLICLGCGIAATPAGVEVVDVELVLAVDVSRSMDIEEFELQRAGYVAALRHPDFVRAVQAGMNGRIAITYFEWAAAPRPESQVNWTIIDGPEAANAFADELEGRPFEGFRGTSISGAIYFGADLFDKNAVEGYRRVIDVSGDGPNNMGLPVLGARNAALAKGIVINGLPILVRPSGTMARLDNYYADCVIGGPGSFMLPIRHPSEFSTAIRRKLILEVSGIEPDAQFVPIQSDALSKCTVGERQRRYYSDPYFPELDR
jgi:hypothetical protein